MGDYEGRLELTWTNKPLRLLSDDDGRYEWVPAADYRVAEIRLLHAVTDVGDSGDLATGNLLIRGDALNALRSLARLPEYAKHYLGKVKLVYIDPPFNTGQAFEQYDDALEHSVWLTMVRDRLLQVRELLAPDGCVWVHLDDAEVHRARCVLDEVFGSDNFVATVIWEKSDSPRNDADYFSGRHDYLHVYRRSAAFQLFAETNGEVASHYNRVDEAGRKFYLKPLRAMGGQGSTRAARPTLYYALGAPDGSDVWPKLPDGGDGAWRWSQSKVEKERDRIEWVKSRDGRWQPYFRIIAPPEGTRTPPSTLWPHTEVGSNRTSKREIRTLLPDQAAFATPKPEGLLERIIGLCTQAGDVVLDCFLGSGTTAAVAHKMGRRWVGIEREAATVADFALPRLQKVVLGQDPGGVTEACDWAGGGGFRLLDVSPSMFEADDGLVFLSDWATNGALSEATAAQLGFEYRPDPPFAGKKGRTRLAVVDGVVDEAVTRLLASAAEPSERVVICGTAIDADVRPLLRELRPGSTLRKIPSSLLEEYRSARELRLVVADTADPSSSHVEVEVSL